MVHGTPNFLCTAQIYGLKSCARCTLKFRPCARCTKATKGRACVHEIRHGPLICLSAVVNAEFPVGYADTTYNVWEQITTTRVFRSPSFYSEVPVCYNTWEVSTLYQWVPRSQQLRPLYRYTTSPPKNLTCLKCHQLFYQNIKWSLIWINEKNSL